MQLIDQVPLAPLTTLGVGGAAQHYVVANTTETLLAALRWARKSRVPVFLLGGGSNVVVSDSGVDGLVVHIALRGVEWRHVERSVEVTVSAGEPWDDIVAQTVEQGWAGLECLSGIPGRVGAAPIQNVGAYGREVGELTSSVKVLDRETLLIRELTASECAFAYRDSAFKGPLRDRYVVLSVTYRLERDGTPLLRYADLLRYFEQHTCVAPTVAEARAAVLTIRRQKSMLDDHADANSRSCGSFFVNPIIGRKQLALVEANSSRPVPRYDLPDGRVKVPAAWLIEHAGFVKGMTDGRVGLSAKHTLALVARDGARATDVVRFARRIRDSVEERFGIRLTPEPVMWGFDNLEAGLPDPRAE